MPARVTVRATVAYTTLALVLVVSAVPVAAGPMSDAWTNGDEVGAGASTGGSADAHTGSAARQAKSSNVTCTYRRLSAQDASTADNLAGTWGAPEKRDGPGTWYQKVCNDGTGPGTATIVWVPDRARVNPRTVAEEALDRAPIPLPEPQLNPPAGQDQVVNVETWLWIDEAQWRPVSASATAGGLTVTATAGPVRVEFDMGNGDALTCAGPGTPYDTGRPAAEQQTDCGYTYTRSSAAAPDGVFTLSATTVWQVTWRSSDGRSGSLGEVARTTSLPVRVAEIQSVNE